jgi:hypothetical protein
LADMVEWVPFFLITTVAALPGLAFLLWITIAHRRAERIRSLSSNEIS